MSHNLTPEILLNDPEKYHRALVEMCDICDEEINGDIISEMKLILNDTTFHGGWYSPHLMLLAYLVGDLPDEIFEENVKQSSKLLEGEPLYWGSLKKNGISENMAIEMLHLMIGLGADVKVKNYYEEDIFDWINEKNNLSSKRINNDSFKKEIIRCYSSF